MFVKFLKRFISSIIIFFLFFLSTFSLLKSTEEVFDFREKKNCSFFIHFNYFKDEKRVFSIQNLKFPYYRIIAIMHFPFHFLYMEKFPSWHQSRMSHSIISMFMIHHKKRAFKIDQASPSIETFCSGFSLKSHESLNQTLQSKTHLKDFKYSNGNANCKFK